MKKYKEYKDSGIAWIGEIPSEWEVKRLKNCFEFHKGGAWGEEATGNSNDYICVRVADFDYKSLCVNSEDYTIRNFTDAQVKKLQLVKGDLLIEKSGGGENSPVGRVVIFDKDFNALYANFIEAIRVAKNGCSNFYNYLFASLYSIGINRKFYSQTTGIQNLNVTDYLNEAYPIPPLQTQQSIADYLDRKTAGINALIADKQKLIDLLREKRQATISEAVTKGLNKNAKMKDSGIEWIGQIPEEWKVITISKVSKIVRGASPRPAGDPLYFNGNDVPWITVAEVTKGDGLYLYETKSFLTFAGKEKSRFIEEGTLLLSNSGATLGVPKISMISGCINDGSVAFTNLSVNQLFLFYVFKSLTTELRKQMQGYGQPNLNTTIIKNIIIPHPVLEEQQAIADYIYNKTAQIDSIISDITEQIEKLKEYRQSSISEVVTGKVAV